MLGTTAGGLYWMFRQLERAEYTTRLLDAGLRISLTRSATVSDGWDSVLRTAGAEAGYYQGYDTCDAGTVVDFVLRDSRNPSSVFSLVESMRANARRVRTALTREMWEAINDCALSTRRVLETQVQPRDLPVVLAAIRKETEYVQGATHATMLRYDRFNFASLGTFVERANNTARLLDVKYFVLLPSPAHVGSVVDNLQWESILRSVSAQRAFRWARGEDLSAAGIADFLILDDRMPRSLYFCAKKITENLGELTTGYGHTPPSSDLGRQLRARYEDRTITSILEGGLHEFLTATLAETNALSDQIDLDYRFTK